MTDFRYPVTPHLLGSTGTEDDTFLRESASEWVLSNCTLVQPKLDGRNLGLRWLGERLQVVLKDREPTPAEEASLMPITSQAASHLRDITAEIGHPIQIFGEIRRVQRHSSALDCVRHLR